MSFQIGAKAPLLLLALLAVLYYYTKVRTA